MKLAAGGIQPYKEIHSFLQRLHMEGLKGQLSPGTSLPSTMWGFSVFSGRWSRMLSWKQKIALSRFQTHCCMSLAHPSLKNCGECASVLCKLRDSDRQCKWFWDCKVLWPLEPLSCPPLQKMPRMKSQFSNSHPSLVFQIQTYFNH